MAKDEINRATRADAGDVVGAPKQQEVAELLKKMKVVADADHKVVHTTEEQQAATPAQTETQQAQADVQVDAQADASQMVASADSIFASDAAPVQVAMLEGGSTGSGGGISTGTLLAIGGVALVGGGIAIAANNDSGGGGSGTVATAVTAGAASVNEGQSVNFNVTGTPGAVLSWSVDAAHGSDVTTTAGSVTLDSTGHGVITITTVADNATEGPETLTLTVDSATATVTINDTSTLPPASNEDLTVLTDGAPTFDFTGTGGANIVSGVAAGGNPFLETFSVGDHVIGNGETVLDLKVAAGGTEAFVSLEHLGAIDLVNGAGVTTATFLATQWTDIGSINLIDGVDGLQANFFDLEEGVDMSVAAGVAGTLYASFTDHVQATLLAGHDSEISWVGNNVDAHVAAGETVSMGLYYSAPAALDLTLGDVTVAVDDNASTFYLYVTDSGGDGTVTVGDVSVTVGLSASAQISVGADGDPGTSHSVVVGDVSLVGDGADYGGVNIYLTEDMGGNVTVGDVTVTGFVNATMDVSRESATIDAPAGSVTVGNVTMSVLASGTLSASVSNTGANDVGGLTVGNVDLTLGQDATGYLNLIHQATNSGNASSDVSVGQTTIGNIAIALDTSATFGTTSTTPGLDILVSASGTSGAVTVGNVHIGNLSIDAAVNAQAAVEVSIQEVGGGAGSGIGDVHIGNVDLTLNDGADITYSVDITAATGDISSVKIGDVTANSENGVSSSATIDITINANNGDIGDITLGNIDLTVGQNAFMTYSASAFAHNIGDIVIGDVTMVVEQSGSLNELSMTWNASSGDLSSFTMGDLSLSVGPQGFGSASIEVSASHNVGPVTFGSVDVSALGTSADASIFLSVSSTVDGDVSSVTFGDVNVKATGTSAFASASFDVYANSGNIGNVTVGDVTVSAATSASAEFFMFVTADDDVGNITLGNVSLLANGVSAFAQFDVTTESNGSGQLGTITLGNVTVDVTGDNAKAELTLTASSASSGGDIVIGDVGVTVDAGTTATASFTFDVSTTNGDITIGDLSISVVAKTNAVNNLTGNVTAGGDISIGMITVSDGDGVSDNLDVFTNVLSVFSAGGDITIAGVDYSGYGASASIDVSGVLGAGTIIGTAFDDTITDNATKNVITGGDGDDIFAFLDTNTGKTAANCDQITDWQGPIGGTEHDTIDLSIAVNVGNYSEMGPFADFASFLAAADGADKAVAVGVVNGNLFIAVDDAGGASDGIVDHVIELVGISNQNQIDVNSFV